MLGALGGGVRSMALLFGVMAMLKQVDQTDPRIINGARAVFGAYVLLSVALSYYLEHVIKTKKDTRKIKVPAAPKMPSLFGGAAAAAAPAEGEAAPGAAEEPAEVEMEVMEYDLKDVHEKRKSLFMNTLFIVAFQLRMASVAPLIITPTMAVNRLFDDPMVKLHILKQPDEGALKRPFKPEPNPLGALLGNLTGANANAAESAPADGAAAATRADGLPAATVEEVEEEEEEVDEGVIEEPEVEEEEDDTPAAGPDSKKEK